MTKVSLLLLLALLVPTCAFVTAPSRSTVSIHVEKGHGTAPSSLLSVPRVRTFESSSLCASSNVDNDTSNKVVLNTGLVRQTVLNQALLGLTILQGGIGSQVLERDASLMPSALLLGAVGVVPLVALSRFIETSESRAFADLNLSTNLLMLRYFGDKPQPLVAFVVSAGIAGLTGLVEETNFRGALIPQLVEKTGGDLPLAVALSTLIFAVLHVNPLGFFNGKEAAQDAAVLVCYQILTGSVFAALYVFTGNLAVPIVAHALFDFYVFFFTHLNVTTQMEYAANEAAMPVAGRGIEAKWKAERGEKFITGCKETFYLADTNRDGVLSREELRIALYSYGIRLSKDESEIVTSAADTDKSGAIDFSEFLDYVGPSGNPSRAIKGSLLGVADRG